MSQGELRLAVLRLVAEPLVHVVLHVYLWQPREDGLVPSTAWVLVSSARYVIWLAWRRVRRRDSGALMAGLGLAVATAVLAGVLAGVTIATDRSTAQVIERIPPEARSVRAVWFGVPSGVDEARTRLDREVRAALAGLSLAGPTPLVLVRESTVAGHFAGLTAVEGLAPYVFVQSGRLPHRCTPARCEVLRLRGRGQLPDATGLRLVEVGRGTLRSRELFGDFLAPTDSATADAQIASALREAAGYHRPAPGPLVVAEGLEVFASSPVLSRSYRTYAWVWPVAAGQPRLWEVDALVRRIEGARTTLSARSGSFALDAPQEELREAQRTASVAGHRLLLVGGEAAALLLAFAILAARGMRRDLDDARRRLTWYGARTWQLRLLTGVESAIVAIAGVLVGWVAGGLAGALAARLSGAPVVPVLEQSVFSGRGLAIAAGIAVVTTVLIAVAVSLRTRDGARIGVLELAGVAGFGVVLIALLGGGVDEARLSRAEGPALLLLLLPGLVALVAAILVASIFRPLARLIADRSWGTLSARLAAVGLARGPGAVVVTVAFLTIAFALAVLAEGYRSTLERGEREQSAFEVPLAVTIREDLQKLVRVFDAASLERFGALAGENGHAYPVLRVTGSAGRAERISGVTVLGLDGGAIERLGVWRRDWAGGKDRAQLAAVVDPGREVALRAAPLPGRELALRVGPGLLSFAAVVALDDGSFRRIELGAADPKRPSTLRARVEPGSQLVTLAVVPPPRLIERGADAGQAFTGRIRVTGPVARELQTWIGVDGVEVSPARAGVDLDYVLTPQRIARVRPRQPTDETPPSVVVSPRLAELVGGVGGLLPVQIGGSIVPLRVAGVIDRFPSSEDEVVVGDRMALRTAINAVAPGSARENELWLDVADDRRAEVAAALMRSPFRALTTVSRADLEEDARRDPLAHGTLFALAAAALVALVLAAIGLALAVRSDVRDDRGELYDLEAQGASPSLLRRVVRFRALVLSVVGLFAGGLVGLALLGLVTRVVSVTARGNVAEPPLVAAVDPLVILVAVAGYGLLAALLVGTTTRRSFAGSRGPELRSVD